MKTFLIGGSGVVGRKMKLTNDKKDRKDQRERTADFMKEQDSLATLQRTPPRYLKGAAKKLYQDLYRQFKDNEQLKVIKQLDLQLLVALCMNYELLRTAYADIQENGQVTKIYKTVVNPVTGDVIAHDFTGFKKNPNVQVIDTSTKNIKALCNELGLSPTSRANILKMDKPKNKGASPEEMAKFFGGK